PVRLPNSSLSLSVTRAPHSNGKVPTMYRKNHCGLASRGLVILGVLALAFAWVFAIGVRPASAADVNKEVSTAAQHAGFAGSSKDMKTTQMHLHHVVNCLVGPQGDGFDASFGNPCDGQGSGAISDTTDTAKKASLQQALQQTSDGLKQSDLAAVQKNAM